MAEVVLTCDISIGKFTRYARSEEYAEGKPMDHLMASGEGIIETEDQAVNVVEMIT